MKYLLILLTIPLLSAQFIDITPETLCQCQQIISQTDCQSLTSCEWIDMECVIISKNEPQPISYCSQFDAELCRYQYSCAYFQDRCTHFTGCFAYQSDNDQFCQSISNRCFMSDGLRCIELGQCNTYLKQSTCLKKKISDSNNFNCYWNGTSCEDADTCSKLPKTYLLDVECRHQISTCTVRLDGGCEANGKECSDNLMEIQCFWNESKSQQCIWDSARQQCKDKICENAPNYMITDERCQEYLSMCTTKLGGGCQKRTSCMAAQVEEACRFDYDGNQCYWKGSSCVDRICSNASVELNTNSKCEEYLKGCLVMAGGGCVQNLGCLSAKVEIACIKNPDGGDCVWNAGYCLDKICQNAPISINTHEKCTQFKQNCTVNLDKNGCVERKCENASLDTQDCEAYLTGCITNSKGGCMKLSNCESINWKLSCLVDSKGRKCFWDSNSNLCKLKTCENIPPVSLYTESYCRQFDESCSATQTSCVLRSCENSFQQYCAIDGSNNKCIWRDKCFMKTCSRASTLLNSHMGCQEYLNTCTVNYKKSGCIEIPILCSGLQIRENCEINRNGGICGWNGVSCEDKNCGTADKGITNSNQCDNYLRGCVVNNNLSGCMELSDTCGDSKHYDNCLQNDCVWYNKECVRKSCINSPDGNCSTYLNNHQCIVNAQQNGCIDKPIDCIDLLEHQCIDGATQNGDCFWLQTKCVNKLCQNLYNPLQIYTHTICSNLYSICTVNINNNGCQNIQELCQSYQTEEQCQFTIKFNKCVWDNLKCRNANCQDAPNTTNYNSHSKCQSYMNTCTVAHGLANNQCIRKPTSCWGMSQSQCQKTYDQTICYWNYNICQPVTSDTNCQNIKLDIPYTHTLCENIIKKCTINSTNDGCLDKSCTNIPLAVQNDLTCSNWSPECTPNRSLDACLIRRTLCQHYSQSECYKADEGLCFWDSLTCQVITTDTPCDFYALVEISPTNCALYNSKCTANQSNCIPKTCDNFLGTPNYQNCQQWLPNCTVNRNHSQCIDLQPLCSHYATENCFKSSSDFCSFNGLNCLPITTCETITLFNWSDETCKTLNPNCRITDQPQCQEKTCTNYIGTKFSYELCDQHKAGCVMNIAKTGCEDKKCENYPGPIYNHSNCNGWLNTCTSNSERSNCILQKGDCAAYQEAECYHSLNDGFCKYETTQCLVQSTNCGDIILKQYSHSSCQEINSSCTVLRDGNGCYSMISGICTSLTDNNCYRVFGSQACIWDGIGCINIDLGGNCSSIQKPILGQWNEEICQELNSKCTYSSISQQCENKSCSNFKGLSVSHAQCNNWSNLCTNSLNGCVAITCSNYPGSSFNHSDCNGWLNSCTRNRLGTQCVTMMNCSQYSKVNCFRSSTKFCHYKNSTCVDIVSGQCSGLLPAKFSDQFCNELDMTCSVNRSFTQCIKMANKCSDIQSKGDCYRTLEGHCNWIVVGYQNLCQKIDNSILCSQLSLSVYNHENCNNQKSTCTFNSQKNRCTDMSCENYSGNIFTHELCHSWMNTCTVNRMQNKCVTIPNNCISNDINNCFRSGTNGNTLCTFNYLTSQCEEVNTQSCSQLSVDSSNNICEILKSSCIQNESITKCITKTCGNYSGNIYTHEKCQEWMNTCTTDRLRTKCIIMAESCDAYSGNDCYNSSLGKCNFKNSTTCIHIKSYTPCTELVLPTFTDQNCTDLHPQCVANGTTSCQQKSCLTKLSGPFTFQSCQEYLSTCSVNSTDTACIDIQSTCSSYNSQINCVRSQQQYCNWYNGSCVDKECEQNTTSTTNQDCEVFMQTCTISRIGHCTPLLHNCSDYLYQQECNLTLNQIQCIWMEDQNKCVDITCDSLPKILTTHEDCNLKLSECTVSANGYGCVSKTNCEGYFSEIQCKINIFQNICIWNTNINPPQCSEKGCQTAPQNAFYQTHTQCQQYLPNCTLSEIGLGCTHLQDCQAYTLEKQCIINLAKQQCAWFENSCKIKGCDTAPLLYNTYDQCQSYQSDCTAALEGCRIIPSSCDQMFTQDQCRFTLQNKQCYWNSITSSCEDRTCDNAPITSTNEEACNSHMKGCTISTAKCAPQVCEDYLYKTDQECAGIEINTSCTTNGIQCVPRGTCLQAITQNACTNDVDGNQCGWYGSYCAQISCDSASQQLMTESQCNEYLKDCVPKLGGGCTSRKQCEDAQIEEACTYEKSGQPCLWTFGKCTLKLCSTLLAGNHQECQRLNKKCTYNGFGRCQNIDNCPHYLNQESCILGLEGTCLWIEGQCYLYENCESLPWKTDSECKLISPLCTSDGNTCVPLTSCSDTNIVAGCINGTDGECLRSIISLDSTSDPVCSLFKSCTDAYYLTHKECQLANKKCTTNTTSNCISLLNCSKYTIKEQCVIDFDGIIYYAISQITSTGICVWDETLFPAGCRNQVCTDLKGETDHQCNSQLSGCTTNGFTCIPRKDCVVYSDKRVCGLAMGTDGECFWHEPISVGVGRCSLKQCKDIPYGQYNDICTTKGNCVSDGVYCIERAKCTQYLTQSACQNTGLDGQCVWRESTCVVMDSCGSAKNNKFACQQRKTYCYWNGNDYQGDCIIHNCSSYYEHNMVCSYFPSFETSQYTVCSFNKSGICVETEPQQLGSTDCLSSSGNTFAWDVVNSTCSACLVVQNITPNTEISISGYVLLLSITMISWI